ncbi:ATP-binding protein [Rhodococcus aetherivorans]|uniref:ATP-binding protein n=1 Tax=Rhodococcus aetherivorans TaxID=191292 RepID=UPI00294A2084|nr:ATP-binding protein [Rhodococcus aetherivorans]MDV6296499.1 ATP-binding protein [Rhodococcus aetherivorans]
MGKATTSTRISQAEKIATTLLSEEDLSALEEQAASATGLSKMWKTALVQRQYHRRARVEQLTRTSSDPFDRQVADLDARGFDGPGGGRMSTVMPPVEYRGTSVQVAGIYPWIVGAKAPLLGTPLGRHLTTGAAVGFDPLYAWTMKAITAPSCFICALNGFGKSTLLRRIALGDIARGTLVLVPGDVKPDLRVLAEQVGGQVSEVGYGTGALNPLDRGPIGDAIEQLPDGSLERERAEFALHARQLNMICALLEIVRRGPLQDFEETLLASAIRLLYAPGSMFDNAHAARLEDLLTLIASGPDELRDDAVADTDEEYRGQIKPLLRSLRALVKGRFGETFNRHSTVRIDITKPMVDLDMSSVPPGDELMRAAVLLAGWNEAFAAVEAAHILADNKVPGAKSIAAHIILDEVWQVIQTGSSAVARLDAVQRLQRSMGVAMTMVTHSLADFEKVGALGMIERSRARIIGPVPDAELDRLAHFMKFSRAERAMVTGWANDTTNSVDEKKALRQARRRVTAGHDGEPEPVEKTRTAAGVGHFLLKLGEGATPGTPFKVWVPQAEKDSGIHDTDARLRAADEDRGTECAA